MIVLIPRGLSRCWELSHVCSMTRTSYSVVIIGAACHRAHKQEKYHVTKLYPGSAPTYPDGDSVGCVYIVSRFTNSVSITVGHRCIGNGLVLFAMLRKIYVFLLSAILVEKLYVFVQLLQKYVWVKFKNSCLHSVTDAIMCSSHIDLMVDFR